MYVSVYVPPERLDRIWTKSTFWSREGFWQEKTWIRISRKILFLWYYLINLAEIFKVSFFTLIICKTNILMPQEKVKKWFIKVKKMIMHFKTF